MGEMCRAGDKGRMQSSVFLGEFTLPANSRCVLAQKPVNPIIQGGLWRFCFIGVTRSFVHLYKFREITSQDLSAVRSSLFFIFLCVQLN